MLSLLMSSLKRCRAIDDLVLATSAEPPDAPLVAFAKQMQIPCICGPLNDVAARFFDAAKQCQADAFVRICGDSPLLDHRLVDQAVALYRKTSPSLVTNVLPRSFPRGCSVEVLNTSKFATVREHMSSEDHREHITSYYYDHPQSFHIEQFSAENFWGDFQMSVDTAEDFLRVERLLERLDRPHWEYGWLDLATRMREMDQEAGC